MKKEYQIFLDYFETKEVMLSKLRGNIGEKDCYELNQQFEIVKDQYLSKSRTQDYYTVIDFFYFFHY